jgi:hypothetical protein
LILREKLERKSEHFALPERHLAGLSGGITHYVQAEWRSPLVRNSRPIVFLGTPWIDPFKRGHDRRLTPRSGAF